MDKPNSEEETFGKYRLLRVLGKGSIADVYLGAELDTGPQVALKVLRMPLSQSDLETFLRHVQTLSQLLHPHLLPILESGSVDNRPFLAMEYAPQGSLRQHYPPGTRLAPKVVLPYVKQIADALDHLHRQHTLHLSIKPENLLSGQNGAILVSDAGLVAALPGAHTEFFANFAGSALYLAPEQIQGTATEASDQYALGCVIYEWLSGAPPFIGSFAEMVSQHLSTPPVPLRTHVPELPPLVEQVVTMAMAKNPAARFKNIEAFADAFESACHEAELPNSTQPEAHALSTQQAEASTELAPQRVEARKEAASLVQPQWSTASKTPICRGCGRLTPEQAGTVCTFCGYPLDAAQERRLLKTVMRDLQPFTRAGGANILVADLARLSDTSVHTLRRVAENGGAYVSVVWLIQHYQKRLQELQPVHATPTASPQSPREQMPQARLAPAPPPRPSPTPRRAPRPSPITALRPLIESPAGLMVAVGTFLLLIAILVLPFAFPGSPLPLPVTLGAQIFFAFMAITTRRSARFREFAGIYAGFFALTMPLLVLDIFQLQSVLTTNIPLVIGLAALYATITYGAFAIYQRFSPFGILCITALCVADLALTKAITGSYQWTVGSLLVLALLGLAALPRHESGSRLPLDRLFDTSWDVLRRSTVVFTRLIVGLVACIYVPVTVLLILNSLTSGTSSSAGGLLFFLQETFSPPLALLVTLVLTLVWLGQYIRRTQWRDGHYRVALLLLLCVLFGCYMFSSSALIPPHFVYSLGFLAVALLYYSMNRFAPNWVHLYLRPGIYLDMLAVSLLCILPFVVAPALPLQVFQPSSPSNQAYPHSSLPTFFDAGVLGISCWLTALIAFRRTREVDAASGQGSSIRDNFWPWLLLLSGLLLTWGYGTAGLVFAWLHVGPFWWFGSLTLVFVLAALLARPRFGRRWSSILDVLVVGEAILTLLLATATEHHSKALVSLALLFFGTLFYIVLLFQRRSVWLFIPWLFVLADLPYLFLKAHGLVLLLGLLLPFVAIGIRRVMPAPRADHRVGSLHDEQLNTTRQWDWPLVTFALICGAFILIQGTSHPTGVPVPWMNASLPTTGEFVAFVLTWYVVAGLERVKWWLVPVGIFALAALFLMDHFFWGLAVVTLGSALLGIAISRLTRRIWALPCYATTLVSSLLAGQVGFSPTLLPLTAWVLLGFAMLAVVVSVLETLPEVLWLVPAFTTGSIIASLQLYELHHQFSDFAHLPVVALLAVCAGVLTSRLLRRRQKPAEKLRLFHSLAPYYAAALIAAVLTGTSFFVGIQPVRQFIPDILLAYALVTFLVLLAEHFPEGNWLVFGFGLWGTLLSIATFPDTLPAIGAGSVIIALLADLLVKQPSNRGRLTASRTIIRPSWGWAWSLVAAVAWTSAGFFPPAFLASVVPDYAVYSLLTAALLVYLTGLIQRQSLLCWVAPLLAIWSLSNLTLQGAFLPLFVVCCLCTLIAVGIDLFSRGQRFSQAAHRRIVLTYALPFVVTAGFAAILIGIAGNEFVPPALRGYAGGLLLIYSVGSWFALLFTRRPRLNGLTAVFGIWGLLLVMQTPVYNFFGWQVSVNTIVTVIGIGAAIFGLLIIHREAPVSRKAETGEQPILQSER